MRTLKLTIRKNLTRSVVMVCLLLGFSFKSDLPLCIIGYVYESGSTNTIANAKVKLYSGNTLYAHTTTNQSGKYEFYGIIAGNYNIEISAPGFIICKQNSVLYSSGKVINKDFYLVRTQVTDSMTTTVTSLAEIEAKMSLEINDGSYSNVFMTTKDISYEQFNTESYDVIKENNYKMVDDEPLSTFSIDVDRASYANVRRFLNQNIFPPKDAVRIEEMINYFDYNYPQPTNADPFSVNMEVAECPWNKDHQLVLVGLQGEQVKTENIPAGNFVFLLDVSGSMSDANKLPLVKQSMKILIDKLRPIDRVAIVVYAGAAGLVLPSTSGTQKEKIIAALEILQAGGSTAGGEGINLAYKIAKENFILGGNNRVILATDGDFNIGQSSDAEMVRLIEEKRKDGVFLTILGYGMGNYKDSKMENMSNAGNGNYAYIDNILEAKKMFGQELWGTLYTIAKDVKIQIEFNPAKVKAYRLVGYENRILNREDFNNDKVDAGDIGSGHSVTALYEIIPAGSAEIPNDVDPLIYQKNVSIKSNDIMTIKLRYKRPNEDVSLLITHKLEDKDNNKGTPSENLRFASAVAEFGMLLRNSEFKGTSSYQHVVQQANASKGSDVNGYRSEFIRLVEICMLLANK